MTAADSDIDDMWRNKSAASACNDPARCKSANNELLRVNRQTCACHHTERHAKLCRLVDLDNVLVY